MRNDFDERFEFDEKAYLEILAKKKMGFTVKDIYPDPYNSMVWKNYHARIKAWPKQG